jgi:DNA-binding transcriptional MocR family regulator
MRRYVPHIVAWHCPQAGAPIAVILPENLSVSDLVRRAARERVELAVAEDPAAPDRVFELHYAHLGEAEIVEGIRRLGYCLARYSELAARWAPGQPGSVVGT